LPVNILAQYQPSRNAPDRDYENSPFCAAFYLALLLEISKDVQRATCFLYVFFPRARPRPVKSLAFDFNINKDTVNEWAHEAALDIFKLARLNIQLQDMRSNPEFNFKEPAHAD
jgi:hypothetical protein